MPSFHNAGIIMTTSIIEDPTTGYATHAKFAIPAQGNIDIEYSADHLACEPLSPYRRLSQAA